MCILICEMTVQQICWQGDLSSQPLSAHRVTGPDPGAVANEACCRLAAGGRSSAGKRVALMAN
jgi:hypothetical protein